LQPFHRFSESVFLKKKQISVEALNVSEARFGRERTQHVGKGEMTLQAAIPRWNQPLQCTIPLFYRPTGAQKGTIIMECTLLPSTAAAAQVPAGEKETKSPSSLRPADK
jgi:hypothetical protein